MKVSHLGTIRDLTFCSIACGVVSKYFWDAAVDQEDTAADGPCAVERSLLEKASFDHAGLFFPLITSTSDIFRHSESVLKTINDTWEAASLKYSTSLSAEIVKVSKYHTDR